MRKLASALSLSLLLLSIPGGCSTTTTTRTVERPEGSDAMAVEKETTVTTERSASGGILSTTVNVVGEIIALPFRIVGGLISIIF